MPPNPPFDISTTMSPLRCSSTTVATMSSIVRNVARTLLPAAQIVHELLGRQPLRFRQATTGTPRRRPLRPLRRTRARSRPGTRAGRTTPNAARTPPRCVDPDNRCAAPTAFRAPPSGDARSRRAPSRHRRTPDDLEPALDALEHPKPVGERPRRDPDVAADGDRRERVAHVVHAEQRRREPAERFAAPTHLEVRQAVGDVDVVACQSAPSAVPNVSTGLTGVLRERRRVRAVGAEQQQAVARHEVAPAA